MRQKKLFITILSATVISACGQTGSGGGANVDVRCNMNGFGQGTCQFTNLGSSKSAICGHIMVVEKWGTTIIRNPKTAQSGTFCSGNVPPATTTSVNFSVSNASDVCRARPVDDWRDGCDFTFVER